MVDTQNSNPQRIDSLDSLRGLGVLGILMVNVMAMAWPGGVYTFPALYPGPDNPLNNTVLWATETFFSLKFITLFSLLFGVSLFLVGGERHDPIRSPLIRNRLLWLGAFGLFHGIVIWYGDILLQYALAGLIVLLMRSFSAKRLIIIGILLYLLSWCVVSGLIILLESAPKAVIESAAADMVPITPEDVQRSMAAFRGDALSSLNENIKNWIDLGLMSLAYLPRTIGVMMLGMGLFKSGFFTGKSPIWLYAAFVVAGAGSLWLIGTSVQDMIARGHPMPEALGSGRAANEGLSLVVTLGYMSIVLLLLRLGAGRIVGFLNPVGRMAFTNYLTQSLIMTAIFWGGRGLGLMGEFDRVEAMLCVFGVWALQIIWSPVWLSQFRMGPFEWVWRCLTQGHLLPIRLDKQTPA
ncbi:MAG: DUF418 domain-containing protein [Asticcacaulis sp.]